MKSTYFNKLIIFNEIVGLLALNIGVVYLAYLRAGPSFVSRTARYRGRREPIHGGGDQDYLFIIARRNDYPH